MRNIKTKNRLLIGTLLVVFALCATIVETSYYGWNWVPKSTAEVIWDFSLGGILLYGWVMAKTAYNRMERKIKRDAQPKDSH